jgi:hypothetical protein
LVAARLNSTVYSTTYGNSTEGIPKRKATEFSNWSWVWALGCLTAVVVLKQYLKNEAAKKLDINVMDEFRERDGAYRIEDFSADEKNGALQNAPKDEEGLIKLKLVKRTKVTHDTYYFRYGVIVLNMNIV